MKTRLLLAAALLLGPVLALAAPRISIELLSRAQPAGAYVTLGEMARMSSPDYALLRSMVDLRVGPAPAAGDSAVVGRDALAAWLEQRAGLARDRVEWKGADAISVVAATLVVRGEAIEAAAEAALRQWLAARSLRSEARLANPLRDVQAGAGNLRLAPRALGDVPVRSRMTVWVDVRVDDRFVRVVPVTFAVSAWSGGLNLPTQEAAPRPQRPAAPAMEPGTRTVRGLLRTEAAEQGPAVVRGQWASLRSGAGLVSAETRVQVLEDGRIGDSVMVRRSAATASVPATVVGAGQLEVAR